MITSFYFVLWIAAYLLIGLSGIGILQQYAFFAALAIVYLLGGFAARLWQKPIEARNRRDLTSLMELYYLRDYDRLNAMARRKLWLLAASFIYMAVATVFIAVMGAWFIAIIFGFFAFQTGSAVHRDAAAYRRRVEAGDAGEVPEGLADALASYSQTRAQFAFSQLMPPPSTGEKALRVFNIVMALLCTLIGAFFLYYFGSIFITDGSRSPGVVIDTLYGALALLYGVTDLFTLIRGYNYSIPL